MGQKGREIVGEEAAAIVSVLNQALAAEATLAYRFLYLSKWAAGIHAPAVVEAFAEMARGEWTHMRLILERIVQLGGRPEARPSEWEPTSFLQASPPPKDPRDLKTMLEDSLAAERVAIGFYRDLVRKTEGRDDVTYWLALEILVDEVGEEERLEKLLQDGHTVP